MINMFYKRGLVLALFLSLFVACSSESTPVQAENSNTDTNAQTDAVADVIQLEDGNFLVEGDMIFTPEQLVSSNVLKKGTTQSAVFDPSYTAWGNNAVIEYYFVPANTSNGNVAMPAAAKRTFARALRDLSNGVAVSFKEVSTPSNYTVRIYTYPSFIPGYGEATGVATVGKRTSPTLRFAGIYGGLFYTTFAHEMSHVLGFMHEQQRPGRDGFVRFEGIDASTLENNINYYIIDDADTLNTSFDMASIMLYNNAIPLDSQAAYKWIGFLPLQSTSDQSARKVLFGSEPSVPSNYYIQNAGGKYLCRSTTGANASLLLNTTKTSLCVWDITTGILNLGQTSQYSGIVLNKRVATTIRSTETTSQGFGIYLSLNSTDNTVGLSVQGGGIQYASKWIPVNGPNIGNYINLWNPLGYCLVVRYNEVTVNNRPCSETDVFSRITLKNIDALGSQYLWQLIPTWNTSVPY